MIDSFPGGDTWEGVEGAFWTFWSEDKTGTYILTALGVILMLVALGAWVWLENRKLWAQAELLRAAGGLPAPSQPVRGYGPSQEPLAGPSTDPGD
jgi:hypothetical protein